MVSSCFQLGLVSLLLTMRAPLMAPKGSTVADTELLSRYFTPEQGHNDELLVGLDHQFIGFLDALDSFQGGAGGILHLGGERHLHLRAVVEMNSQLFVVAHVLFGFGLAMISFRP